MDARTVGLEMKFTRMALAVLLGSVLFIVGGALAQSPEPHAHVLEVGDYDPNLYPQLPRQMNYQGILTDETGNPVHGSQDLTLTIYRRGIGFPAPWYAVYSETQTVEVNHGLFNVVIGASTPLDPGVFEGLYRLMGLGWGQLELGVTVDGGPELMPRTKLLPVPYAFRAEYVNRFPRPHYDSGWEDLGFRVDPIQVVLQHKLLGDPDDYVVDLQCGHAIDGTRQCFEKEAYWHSLTDETMTVWVTNDWNLERIRVRIWRVD